ncbi:MAG: hypothetical protein P4M11_03230 [Candidatus Pacebacteria bacterium]|nr:hypothetical protein [Candidatus Paceibacterota bacterium]
MFSERPQRLCSQTVWQPKMYTTASMARERQTITIIADKGNPSSAKNTSRVTRMIITPIRKLANEFVRLCMKQERFLLKIVCNRNRNRRLS